MVWEAGATILSAVGHGVQHWRDRQSHSESETRNKIKAVGKVMAAAIATKAYLYDSKELGVPSRERENMISQAWQEAATAIRRYDENLFLSSQVKSLGWSDPREWEKLAGKAVTVDIDRIIEQCEWIKRQTK